MKNAEGLVKYAYTVKEKGWDFEGSSEFEENEFDSDDIFDLLAHILYSHKENMESLPKSFVMEITGERID